MSEILKSLWGLYAWALPSAIALGATWFFLLPQLGDSLRLRDGAATSYTVCVNFAPRGKESVSAQGRVAIRSPQPQLEAPFFGALPLKTPFLEPEWPKVSFEKSVERS
jgi:hypothetical protein